MISRNKKFIISYLTGILVLFLPYFALADYVELTEKLTLAGVKEAWSIVLGLVNIIAVLGLIFIALAYLFRIDIETYDIKRTLPGLIVGIILANFSYFLCIETADFVQSITNFFNSNAAGSEGIYFRLVGYLAGRAVGSTATYVTMGVTSLGAIASLLLGTTAVTTGGLIFAGLGLPLIILAAIIVLGPAILWLLLAILLYIRFYVVTILVVVSPIAIVLYFLPFGKLLAGQWFDWLLKWLFVGPLVFFLVWLMGIFVSDAGGTTLGGVLGTILLSVLLVYLPFQLIQLGNLMEMINGLFGGVAKKIGLPIYGKHKMKIMEGLRKKAGKEGQDGGFWTSINNIANRGAMQQQLEEAVSETTQKENLKKFKKMLEKNEDWQEILRTHYHSMADDKAEAIASGGIIGALGALYAVNADTRMGAIRALGQKLYENPDFKDRQDDIVAILQEYGEIMGLGKDYFDPSTKAGQKNLADENSFVFDTINGSDVETLQEIAGLEGATGDSSVTATVTFDQINNNNITIDQVNNLIDRIKNKNELDDGDIRDIMQVTNLPREQIESKESAMNVLHQYQEAINANQTRINVTGASAQNVTELERAIENRRTIDKGANIVVKNIREAKATDNPSRILGNQPGNISGKELIARDNIRTELGNILQPLSRQRFDLDAILARLKQLDYNQTNTAQLREEIREQIEDSL